MSTFRSTFTAGKGTEQMGWASCYVLCGLIALLFILYALPASNIAFASTHVVQQPESLTRFGVSLVRIVTTYGPQVPNVGLPPPPPSTNPKSATTGSLDSPIKTCTGLGVIVASKANTTQQNAWVLTDGSLVNVNEFTCKNLGPASVAGKQLSLASINVYLSNAYSNTQSTAISGIVQSVKCSAVKKCNDGAAIFAFHSNTLLPYAQLTPATEDFAAIQLSQSLQVTTPPTASANLQQFLTPTSATVQKSTPGSPNAFDSFENGTPIVDTHGVLSQLFLKDTVQQAKFFKEPDVIAFLSQQQISSDPGPNDVSSNWNHGIDEYYKGASHYAAARSFFTKANMASDNQFQGTQGLIASIDATQANQSNTTSTANAASTSGNGITLPLIGFVSYLLLAIIVVGVILFLLLLIVLNQLFKRGQRNRDFAEADRQATEQVRSIQEMERQQFHPAPQQPVSQGLMQPTQQTADPVASRSSVVPAASTPTNASYADYPTIDMSETKGNAMPDIDKTQPFLAPERTVKFNKRLGFEVITSTDPGIKRKYKPNEDSLFAVKGVRSQDGQMQQIGLFVVADGMGGHANGQDASRLAIQTIVDYLLPRLFHPEESNEAPEKLLVDSVQRANQAVHEHNMENGADMGTTVTATLITDTTAHVANVGDSRTYLYRITDGLSKVTHDHSVVASLVDAGLIKPDDIYTHPKRNQIYRSLGDKPFVEVDPFDVELQPGDKLLLCSDGLWDMVRDPEIKRVLEMPTTNPQQLGDNLIKAAHAGGGEDNVSVIVINIVERPKLPLNPGLEVIYRQENIKLPQM